MFLLKLFWGDFVTVLNAYEKEKASEKKSNYKLLIKNKLYDHSYMLESLLAENNVTVYYEFLGL